MLNDIAIGIYSIDIPIQMQFEVQEILGHMLSKISLGKINMDPSIYTYIIYSV